MRLFVEAVLDPSALDACRSAGRTLAAGSSFPERRVRWVAREASHLTLRFLGEVEDDRAPEIAESLSALEGSGGFELQFDRVGRFGGRRPRVIWIGFAADTGLERLWALRSELDSALETMGIEPERTAFRPHLTLGRVRRRASPDDLAAIRAAVDRAEPLRQRAAVGQVALVHSTLLTDGPHYRRLARIDL